MMKDKRWIIRLAAMIWIAAVAMPAHALKIRNLDAAPRSVTVTNGGESAEHSIKPGRYYVTTGASLWLRYGAQEPVLAHPMEEYIILHDRLILQMRSSRGGNR